MASGGWRPETLLNTLACTGRAQHRAISSKCRLCQGWETLVYVHTLGKASHRLFNHVMSHKTWMGGMY